MMRTTQLMRCVMLACIIAGATSTVARAQLTATINLPQIVFDKATQRYAPPTFEVELVLHNATADTLPLLSGRIEIVADLSLDATENGALIKAPAVPYVLPHDSTRIKWRLVHPVVYTVPKAYRINCSYVTSAVDSGTFARNLTIPAAGAPVLWLNIFGTMDLRPTVDSLAYAFNPFFVHCWVRNQGETPADSVKLQVLLPPGFEVMPTGTPNPFALPAPLWPIPIGDPRLEYQWTVRYKSAPQVAYTDSIVIVGEGRDRNGQPVLGRTSVSFTIHPFQQRAELTLDHPGSLSYDADSIYAPQPVRVHARLINPTTQDEVYRAVVLTVFGDGVELPADPVRMLPVLEGRDTLDFVWDLHVDRAAQPRMIRWNVALRDMNNAIAREVSGETAVPGEPFSFDVTGFTLPDSLEPVPDRSRFAQDSVIVEYRIRNSSWMRQTITRTRVEALGVGVKPGLPIEASPLIDIAPGDSSPVLREVFHITPSTADRQVSFRITAYSNRDDTARALGAVRVPALAPQIVLTSLAPDTLTVSPTFTYTPNPFQHRVAVHNVGGYPVPIDSLTLAWNVDGVTSDDPVQQPVFRTLAAGDSIPATWIIRVAGRDSVRHLELTTTAWSRGEIAAAHAHRVLIPALTGDMKLTFLGDDTLVFNGANVYMPPVFAARLEVRSTGSVPVIVDSVVCVITDPFVRPRNALSVAVGEPILPNGGRMFEWNFDALRRPSPRAIPIDVTVHYDGGKTSHTARTVYIPGRPTSFGVSNVNAPLALHENATSSGYTDSVFTTSFRAWNDSWVWTTFTSSTVTISGRAVRQRTPVDRSFNLQLTGDQRSPVITDTFQVSPSSLRRTLVITFTVRNSDGETGTTEAQVDVPKLLLTGFEDAPVPTANALAVWPNPWAAPAAHPLTIAVQMAERGEAEVSVLDLTGRLVERLHSGTLDAGEHTIAWRSAVLRAGTYAVVLRSGARVLTRLCTVLP